MNKILIATKEILPAEIMKMLISNKKAIRPIEIVHDGDKALNFIINNRPKLVLIDIYLPALNAISLMEELNRLKISTKIICFCNEISSIHCMKLFKAGISGIIDYKTTLYDAKKILTGVEAGKIMIPNLIENKISKRDFEINSEKYYPLTLRQKQVLQLAGEGYSNTRIAELLNISRKTVEKHKCSIKEKMGLSSSTEIAVYAVTHGLVEVRRVV